MADDLRGYTEQETLNKVLNTDNDSIQVDIVDATGVTITATDASVYVDDADWTDSTSSHTLVGGLYQSSPQTITNGDVGPLQVDADGALHISDGGNTITVDGTVTANLGSTDNTVLDNIDSNTDYGATTGGGTESGALRVTIASNSTGVLSIDDNSGSITVDNGGTFAVQSTLQAGSASIGTLGANSGTDIGDVDVTSVVPGYAATSLGKREDDAHSTLDVGVMSLAVRNDDVAAIGSADGDYAPLQVNAAGSLYTTDATGEAGSILVTGTSAVTTGISGTKFIAIQFIEDTVFASSGGLVAASEQLYPDDTGVGSDISSNGAAIDGVTFPQGMTIFGRWNGFTLASGKVIGYIGYV